MRADGISSSDVLRGVKPTVRVWTPAPIPVSVELVLDEIAIRRAWGLPLPAWMLRLELESGNGLGHRTPDLRGKLP